MDKGIDMDYRIRDIVCYVLNRLGYGLIALDAKDESNDIDIYINVIKHKTKYLQDQELLSFINYFL